MKQTIRKLYVWQFKSTGGQFLMSPRGQFLMSLDSSSAFGPQAEAIAADRDDMTVVQEPIKDGGGDDVIANPKGSPCISAAMAPQKHEPASMRTLLAPGTSVIYAGDVDEPGTPRRLELLTALLQADR